MAWFLVALFVIGGALLGALIGFGLSLLGKNYFAGRMEIWSLGAEAGPTSRDREIAKRRYDRQNSPYARWLAWTLTWWFRVLLPVFGGLFGLALAHRLGGMG